MNVFESIKKGLEETIENEPWNLTDKTKKITYTPSPEPIKIAYQAMTEQAKDGCVTVACPKCMEHPKVSITPGGERTLVLCKCRYIQSGEIYFWLRVDFSFEFSGNHTTNIGKYFFYLSNKLYK